MAEDKIPSGDKLSSWLKNRLFNTKEKDALSSKDLLPKTPVSKFQNSKFPMQKNNQKNFNQKNMIQTGPRVPAKNPAPQAQHDYGSGTVRICALGGLNEVGKNMMFFEYVQNGQKGPKAQGDIVIVDMGFQFPDAGMLGIDYIVPDITYLIERRHNIRGILLTHGHLDHIGAIPYLIEKLGFPPIYGTRLTIGFVNKRLEEFGLTKSAKVHNIHPDDILRLGHFTASFFRVNHSIPDAVGVFLESPAGSFVHTGDFKFDMNPAGDQRPAEFDKIASYGKKNVLALFSDSTNALKPGQTISEQKVANSLEAIIKKTEGRIIVTAFSSLIGRLQQLLDFAQKYKRQVFLTGRSMLDNMEISRNLGHLKYPNNLIHDISKLKSFPDERVMIFTTGSQGEDVSALSRISVNDHPHVRLKKGDTIIISATPIVGNERAVNVVINNLCRQGAHVFHSKTFEVHTSGHACQEDLKLMMTLVKPKYLVPVHGEYFMRIVHKDLGKELGMKDENGIIVENGDIMEASGGRIRITGEKVPVNYILVDGLGMGDVGTQVIEERVTMSENGVLVLLLTVKGKKLVRDPEIISRGFIYMQESEKIMQELIRVGKDSYKKILDKKSDASRNDVKRFIRSALERKAHELIERRPLILPIIIEEGQKIPEEHLHDHAD